LAIIGDGATRLEPLLAGLPTVRFCRPILPEAVAVARLAAERAESASPPRPFYLRAPDVTLPGRPR
jgi:tRNA threonylcarbamoyladenosine biosynthesis protein TsaB